jgi:hypothetical protein
VNRLRLKFPFLGVLGVNDPDRPVFRYRSFAPALSGTHRSAAKDHSQIVPFAFIIINLLVMYKRSKDRARSVTR